MLGGLSGSEALGPTPRKRRSGYREFPYDLVGNFWGYEAVQSRARNGLSMRGAVAPQQALAFDQQHPLRSR